MALVVIGGVLLSTLLEMCGYDKKNGKYVLAEGADGSSMTRTIPMEMVESGEVFVAYGQNGEMLRLAPGEPEVVGHATTGRLAELAPVPGQLPDLHANPGTTARVYDRTKLVNRRSL